MKFGTAALLGDSCTRQLSSCLGDKAQGLSPQLIPQKFPPNTPEIRSGADPAAPWDAVDVSVLHNGGPKLKCNGQDEIAQIQSRARLGWVTQRGFFSSSWRSLQYVFVALQGQQRFASSPLGFRFHPHLREPGLPTLRHHPRLRVLSLLKPSQIIQQSFPITRPEPKCFAAPAAAVAFAVETSLAWNHPRMTAGTSQPQQPPRGTASCTTPATRQTHPGSTGLPPAVDTWRKRCQESESSLK